MSVAGSIATCHFGGFVCASLGTELARRKAFARSFADPAQLRFVESVDGRGWSEAEADTWVTPELRDLRQREAAKGKRWIGPPAIACALTHRDCLLAAAETDDVILCEDDARVSRDFIDAWQVGSVRSMFRDCGGVVLAHYRANQPIVTSTQPHATFGRYGIYRLTSEHIMSGASYYCPPSVARDIRQLQRPISTSADDWLTFHKRVGFDGIYLLHPSPIRLMPFASTIGYSTRWLARQNGKLTRMARELRRKLSRSAQGSFDSITNFEDLRR